MARTGQVSGLLPARQAELGPPALLVDLARGISRRRPSGVKVRCSRCTPTSSLRRSAAAKPSSRSARSRGPVSPSRQVATSLRISAVPMAAARRGRHAVLAGDAGEGVADRRVRGRPGVPGHGLGAADGGDPAAQRGTGMGGGERGEVAGHGDRCGRQGCHALRAAPCREVGPIGGVGGQRRRREGSPGVAGGAGAVGIGQRDELGHAGDSSSLRELGQAPIKAPEGQLWSLSEQRQPSSWNPGKRVERVSGEAP